MNILAALTGMGIALGLILVASGLRPRQTSGTSAQRAPFVSFDRTRLLAAVALAFPAALVTRWPVAALGTGAAGWFWPEFFGGQGTRERDVARTEAIASWTEMLRDLLAGAHGLEQTIVASADIAPPAIRPEVTALAVRIEREPLTSALDKFADELAHPTGDLVVTALKLAAQGATGDLAELLGTLAVSARDEAGLRLRVEASRARLRTAVRVIATVTATTALGLLLLNRQYLNVYGSASGQSVLFLVAAAWGLALWWLARMSQFMAPERFLVRSRDAEAGS